MNKDRVRGRIEEAKDKIKEDIKKNKYVLRRRAS